jgi:hypothetical protein
MRSAVPAGDQELRVGNIDLAELAAPLLKPGEELLAGVRVNWNGMVPPTKAVTAAAGLETSAPEPDALVSFPSAKQMAIALTGGRLLVWSLGFSGKPKQYIGEVPMSALAEVHFGQLRLGGLVRLVMKSGAVVDLEAMRNEPAEDFFAQLQHLVAG